MGADGAFILNELLLGLRDVSFGGVPGLGGSFFFLVGSVFDFSSVFVVELSFVSGVFGSGGKFLFAGMVEFVEEVDMSGFWFKR